MHFNKYIISFVGGLFRSYFVWSNFEYAFSTADNSSSIVQFVNMFVTSYVTKRQSLHGWRFSIIFIKAAESFIYVFCCVTIGIKKWST
jgi:hypothetical protein